MLIIAWRGQRTDGYSIDGYFSPDYSYYYGEDEYGVYPVFTLIGEHGVVTFDSAYPQPVPEWLRSELVALVGGGL